MKISRDEDPQKKLIDYFKRNLKKGYTTDSLKWALIRQGYSRTAIERTIREVNRELARQAPILKEKPIIKYELVDENGKSFPVKKPWWKKIFGD